MDGNRRPVGLSGLWHAGTTAFRRRTPVRGICLSAAALLAADELVEGVWVGGYGLLEQAVKQHPAGG